MTVILPAGIEEQVRRLAAQQGREVDAVVEEAVRFYIEASSITDVSGDAIGQAQMKMTGEIGDIPPWNDKPENGTHATR
jgi:hypothetical protein